MAKCTQVSSCIAADWFGTNPAECSISSECTLSKAVIAPTSWGIVTLLIKNPVQGKTVMTIFGVFANNDIYGSNAFRAGSGSGRGSEGKTTAPPRSGGNKPVTPDPIEVGCEATCYGNAIGGFETME